MCWPHGRRDKSDLGLAKRRKREPNTSLPGWTTLLYLNVDGHIKVLRNCQFGKPAPPSPAPKVRVMDHIETAVPILKCTYTTAMNFCGENVATFEPEICSESRKRSCYGGGCTYNRTHVSTSSTVAGEPNHSELPCHYDDLQLKSMRVGI